MSTAILCPPADLIAAIARQSERGVAPEISLLVDNLKIRFGDSLDAIILYGSCLRSQQFTEGVVDLYVLVNSYNAAYTGTLLRCMNAWLPPNVFYLEVDYGGASVRAKYAVISGKDLRLGCSQWFHSYIWSRFAQPAILLYTRNPVIRDQLHLSFGQAVLTFLHTTIPALGSGRFDARKIWTHGLSLTYAAELRPERHTRASQITGQGIEDFARLTDSAAPALTEFLVRLPEGDYQCTSSPNARRHAIRSWRIRRWQGLVLSVLRLTKAVYTFRDCVDYAAWKIHRHTGITIKVTPALRRHPILFGFSVLWQLIKRDGLH